MSASSSLRFGVMFGYWQAAPPKNFIDVAQEAERLGFHSAWTAEAWGSDTKARMRDRPLWSSPSVIRSRRRADRRIA